MNLLDFSGELQINSCGATDCEASWHWDTGKDGFRDFDLWIVCRGSGEIRTICSHEEVSVGLCLILFPDTHYVGTQGANRLLVMNVHFRLPQEVQSALTRDGKPFLHRHVFDLSFMKDCLSRVIRLYNAGKRSEATVFFRAALTEYFTQEPSEAFGGIDSEKRTLIDTICDRINLAPAHTHRLVDIAAEYGYSADYLGRIFTRAMGISFSDYLSNARINQAKYLLSSTELTVERISEMLGYYDACYFSRQFRRIAGIVPSQYRREKGK